jgi:hypothetical protein
MGVFQTILPENSITSGAPTNDRDAKFDTGKATPSAETSFVKLEIQVTALERLILHQALYVEEIQRADPRSKRIIRRALLSSLLDSGMDSPQSA